jgi:HEAT repeat protein
MTLYGPPNVEKMKAKKDVQGLIEALDYRKDNGIREAAARALGEIGDKRAAKALIDVLINPWSYSKEVQCAAAVALGEIGDARAAESLINAFAQARYDVRGKIREGILQGLVALGALAVEPLIARLKSRDGDLRELVIEALGKIGDARAAEPLILVFGDVVDAIRNHAFKAVVEIGAPAVEPLIAALSNKNAGIRNVAAQALGRIEDARAVEPLIAALADTDEIVPQMAAKALGWIGDPRAVEPLIRALKSKNLLARQPAVEALGLIRDPRAVQPLIAALKEGLPPGKTPRNIKESDWLVFIGKHGFWMRQEAAGALIAIGAASVDPLMAVLRDEDTSVRGFAASALGEIGEKRVTDSLIPLLEDEDNQVREAAASALEKLGWQPQGSTVSEVALDAIELKQRYLQGERNFNHADLRSADLSWTDLSEINLEDADLRDANLKGATLVGATLRGANLQGANLYGATLRGADLSEANLYGADLTGAFMLAANLMGATLPDGTKNS